MPTYIFHVLLLDAKGRPFPGLTVQIFEKDPTAPGPLEQGLSGSDGRISFSITANRFKNPAAIPQVYFKVLQDGKEVLKSSNLSVVNIQGEERYMTLTTPGEIPADPRPYIHGYLEGEDGEPLSGIRIVAAHEDNCMGVTLGETKTDAQGYYKVVYAEALRQQYPWLNVRVTAFITNEPSSWIRSPFIVNPGWVEQINLAVGGGAYRGPSRFSILQKALAQGDNCHSIGVMAPEMIAALAKKNDAECTEVVQFFWARALRDDTGAEPALFFAFQKAGLSPLLTDIVQQDKNTLEKAIADAAEQNLIPYRFARQAGEMVQTLRGTTAWGNMEKTAGDAFLKHFHRPLTITDIFSQTEQALLRDKIQRHFQQQVCQALGADDPVTRFAVAALKLDPLALKDRDFMTVVRENVLAPLQQSNLLSGCNRKILVSAESLTGDGRTVGEVLGLGQALKTHPAFHREALRVKMRTLAGLAGMSPAAIGQLADENLYLDLMPDTQWDELVEKGILNAEQKFSLQKLYTFGKLTDFHFDLVKVLRDDPRAKTGKDLASLTAGDWTALLTKAGNSTPNSETPAVYIKNLMAAVEASYPAPAFYAATLKRGFIKLDTPLQALKPLLDKNEKLFTGNAIDWSGVPEKDRPAVEQNLKTIRAFANAYRHLGIPEILESRQSVQAKGQAAQDAVRAVQRLVDQNPDMDIRTANFIKKSSVAKPGEVNWSTVPAEFRDKVQRQMLAFQRVRNLAPDTTQATALLDMGADSAHKITAMPKNRFVQESGLEPAAAETIYANAQHAATVAMHHLQAAREVFQNQLMGLPVDNTIEHAHRGYLLDKNLQSGECEGPAYSHGNSLYSQLRNELLHVSGFEDLFGPQNFCQCDHCKSVLSPAAYFVDMMYWIEKHITGYSSAETALLQQHCENKFTDHPLWLHNRRPDLWDLKVTCENTYELVPYLQIVNEVMEAYIKKLTGWTDIYAELLKPANQISFYSPRALPFYEMLILLEHFDVKLSDIAKANRANAGVQEMALLEAQQVELNYTSGSIFQKFGNKTAFSKMKVSEFLKHTRIGRRELDALLATNYVKKNQNIKIEKTAFDPGIQYYEEELTNLTSDALLRIHFFLKLRGKTRWSIPELDLVFSTLDALLGPPAQGANPYQPNQISAIVALLKLQKHLGVGLEELVGIVHQLPNVSLESVEKKDPLTQELFQEKKPGYLARKFRLEKIFGANTSLSINLTTQKDTEPFAFFLAGLNISRDEFEVMQTWKPSGTSLFDTVTLALDKLTPVEMSRYYRHVCLARCLKLSLPEWEKVLRLTQLLPDSISNTLALVERAMELKDSPFSLDELLLLTDTSGNTPLADKDIFVAGLHKPEYPSFTGEILRPIKSSVFTDAKISALLTKWEKDGLITPAEDKEAYRLTTKFNWKALQQSTGLIVSWQTYGNGIKDALNPYHYLSPVAGLYVEQKKILEIGNLEKNDLRILLPKLAAHIASVPSLYSWFRVLDSYKTSELGKAIESLPTDTSENQARKQRLTDSMASIDQVLSAAMLKPQYLKVWTAFTGLSSEQAEALLPMVENDWLANYLSNFCQETVDGVPIKFDALWRQMQRLKIVVEKLQLTAADLRLLAQNHAGVFGISDIKTSKLLTLQNLQALEQYCRWTAFGPDTADTVLTPALLHVKTDKSVVQAAFLQYFGIPYPVTESVWPGVFLASQSSLDVLQMLKDQALLCHRLGLSGTQLALFSSLAYSDAKVLSAALLASFQKQYDAPDAFSKAFDPYQERLNELKCELLRDYILARVKDVNFQTTNDLYVYFLLDTEMGGCLKISRIVAAHMSIQLYVHRVLMRLEQSENGRFNAALDPDAADEWPWRKNYRVWEANRKVFLYPENYLEPEWRDNKSPEFKQLEEELLQQKISIESAEGAYKEYLKKFSELGRLVIAGAVFNENNDTPTHYIFGRTVSDPYIYYYRKMKMVGAGTKDVGYDWSPWQKIDLSISSPEITAVIHRNKIYIFWADILSEELSGFSNGNSDFQGTRHKITLLYSCLNENGKWLQPQRVDFHDYEGKMDNYSGYQNEIDRLMHDGVIPSLGSTYERKYKTRDRYQKSRFFKKLYVEPDERHPERLSISYIREYLSSQQVINFDNITRSLNLSTKTLTNQSFNPKYHFYINVSKFQDVGNAKTYRRLSKSYTGLNTPYVLDYFHDKPGFGIQQWTLFDIENLKYADCLLVSNSFLQENKWLSNDLIIKLDDEYLLLHKKFGAPPGYKYALVKLNTNVVESLQEYLFAGGVEGFTSIETQRLSDNQIPAVERDFSQMEKPPHDRLNFFGAHGLYFWELFFHIPSLIADHLNAEGKYKDADWWYRRIFNPMAAKD
ncbi:MAG: hypothetical protein JNJ90_04700, partial [Saprospiraceae bacterium]|nr:hypothetical protein [Saprospiraceae bacterium]